MSISRRADDQEYGVARLPIARATNSDRRPMMLCRAASPGFAPGTGRIAAAESYILGPTIAS